MKLIKITIEFLDQCAVGNATFRPKSYFFKIFNFLNFKAKLHYINSTFL